MVLFLLDVGVFGAMNFRRAGLGQGSVRSLGKSWGLRKCRCSIGGEVGNVT